MKKLILIFVALIAIVSNVAAQKEQKRIGAVGYWKETNTTFPNLTDAIYEYDINCNETIRLYDIDWLVFRKDTLPDKTILYYVLKCWCGKEKCQRLFPKDFQLGNVVQSIRNKHCKIIKRKPNIEYIPIIISGTYWDIKNTEIYDNHETGKENMHKLAFELASKID